MNRGDIFLVDVDFIDSSASKVRPALIISSNNYNKNHPDVIILSITTNSSHDCFLPVSEKDLSDGAVYSGSGVRYDTVTRVENSKLVRKVGKATKEFCDQAARKLLSLLLNEADESGGEKKELLDKARKDLRKGKASFSSVDDL